MKNTSFLKDCDHLLTQQYLHKKLVEQKLTVKAYSKLIGVSTSLICSKLREYGIDLRKAREDHIQNLTNERMSNMADGFKIRGKSASNPYGRVTAIMR